MYDLKQIASKYSRTVQIKKYRGQFRRSMISSYGGGYEMK